MFELESDIPIPDPRDGGRPVGCGKKKYPLAEMNVGDSFFHHCVGAERTRFQMKIHWAATAFRKYHGNDFRITTKSEPGGIRVWRVR